MVGITILDLYRIIRKAFLHTSFSHALTVRLAVNCISKGGTRVLLE